MGGGSGHMNGWKVDSYLEEIRRYAPAAQYAPGYLLREGFPPKETVSEELIREAIEAARKADTVIMIAGPGYCTESEGYDRRSIELPEGQRRLLDELTRLDAHIVLVLSCASVLNIAPWKDKLDAVLYNSLGGEAAAGATARILFGEAQPGGRLAETWPVCEAHTPSYMNFARGGKDMADVLYGEDIYIGYRWYEKRSLEVLYPFGHGLSYTSFRIGQPVVKACDAEDGNMAAAGGTSATDAAATTGAAKTADMTGTAETAATEHGVWTTPNTQLEITLPVTNTGSRPGSEVIQLYLSWPGTSICDHPVKELKAFAKVTLAPGETRNVVLRLKCKDFAFYAPAQGKWIIEDGEYTLHIGTSSEDILYRYPVCMQGGDIPFVYTEMTPLVWFINNPRYHEILKEDFPPEVEAQMNQDTFEWVCLILPLPFYKVTEGYMGPPIMTREQMQSVLKKMNAAMGTGPAVPMSFR